MRYQIIALVIAVAVAGCTPGKFSQQAGATKAGVFRYPIVTNPTTMDPHMVQDGDTIDLLQQMYEGLVGWSPDNEPVGYLAESWVVDDTGTVYTFKLRENAKFHNGRKVTADDVKWSFERVSNPKMASPVADAYFSDIVGFTDRINGTAPEVAGIKVVDESHVSITVKKPTPYFLGKLTYIAGAVLPKESVPAEAPMTSNDQLVGSGPFQLDKLEPQQLIVLKAFKDYHAGAPTIEKIERPVIGDAVTRLNKYKNGELDLVQLERQDIAALQADPKFKDQLKFFQRPAIWYVGLNRLMFPPFKDKRVRQAIAMAVNKENIVNELLGGVNTVATGIVPPGVPGGDRKDAASFKYDPVKAAELLKQAGYPGGKGLPALTLTFRADRPDIKIVAEAVSSQLKTNLGVESKLQEMEWGAYLQKYNAKKQTFYHMRWAADYLDPQNFLSQMLATWGPENKLGYDNPAFDTLCAKADETLDMEKRLPLYSQAEDIALQDAVWIPIYFQRDAELISPKAKGLRESLFGHLPHTTVSIEQ